MEDAATPPRARLPRRLPLYPVFLAIFTASGVAALVYQIVWQRLLTLFSGADVYSVTLIVMAFMAGLGFGSLAGGHLADRLSPRGRVLAFAAAEAAVAAFASVSTPFIYGVLYLRLGEQAIAPGLITLLLFLVLVGPTFLMGLSLPLLSRALTETAARAGERVGGLYGWNTLGAAIGAIATFALVRQGGFEGAVAVGAVLNLGAGTLALATVGAFREQRTAAVVVPASPAPGRPVALSEWLACYALSGFIALSLEIIWFRILGTILKSTSFTFPTLLTLYLAGLGLGALVGRRFVRSSSHPERVFFGLQFAIPVWAAVSVLILVLLLGSDAAPGQLLEHLRGGDPLELAVSSRAAVRFVLAAGEIAPWARDAVLRFVIVMVLVPLGLILVPTLLMGASFPFLQARVQTDLDALGRRVGWLQTANIVGSTAGAGLTGVILLEWLGSPGTLRLLVVLGAVFLLLLLRSVRVARPTGLAATVVVAGGLALLVPSGDALWARLLGTDPARVRHAEDGSGVSVLKELEEDGRTLTRLYVGGVSQSHLPFGGYHAVLGALPTLVHPAPRRVAVIGLGSGNTLWGAGGRLETERMDVMEIVRSQVPLLRSWAREVGDDGLTALLADGRVRIRLTDGRTHLMRSRDRWDVIEADALRPASAYAGNLYSREFFDLVRRRLRPGGIGVTWCPTPRVRDTFVLVFPYVLQIGDMLLGSNEEIAFDAHLVRSRLHEPAYAAYFHRAGVAIDVLVERELDEREIRTWGPDADRAQLTDMNTDLHPRDEYLVSEPFWPRRRDDRGARGQGREGPGTEPGSQS